jgi:hypothetical protein
LPNVNTSLLSFQTLVSRIGADAKFLTVPNTALDFSVATSYVIDLTAAVSSAQLTAGIQTVFIDCSKNLYCDTYFSSLSGQSIIARAGTQGYYPIITSGSDIFTVTSFPFAIYNGGKNQGPGTGLLGQVDAFPLPKTANSSVAISFLTVPYVCSVWQAAEKRSVNLTAVCTTTAATEQSFQILQLQGTSIEIENVTILQGSSAIASGNINFIVGDGNLFNPDTSNYSGVIFFISAKFPLPGGVYQSNLNAGLKYALTANSAGTSRVILLSQNAAAAADAVVVTVTYKIIGVTNPLV